MKNLLLVSSFIIFFSSCAKESHTLRYEIGCTDCMVVYVDENGDQQSVYHVNSNWVKEIEVESGIFLLMAYNTSGTPEAVTARMKLDGEIWQERTTYCPISGVVLITDTLP